LATSVSKRGGIRVRAGARALSLLATAPNPVVLEALAEGPSSLVELQGRAGAPGSTLRARLKELADLELIVSRPGNGFRGAAAKYELTDAGRDLCVVAGALESWLMESPNAKRALGGGFPKAAIGALVEGWSSTLLRALAARPLSVADLDSLIAALNYPSLERRIAAMRNSGLVEACRSNGRETPYAVTPWLRRGMAPVLAAIRWERRHLRHDVAPVAGLDVEAALLLAIPLVEVEPQFYGRCRLAVELPGNGSRPVAGVVVEVAEGGVRSCASRLNGDVDAWVSGPVGAVLRALTDGDDVSLERGGDGRLARALLGGLQSALFAPSHYPDAVGAAA
jgi:DNA-binding HxlR family transcriptional regulator